MGHALWIHHAMHWIFVGAGEFDPARVGWILATIGALAAGIGIWRAGFALGRSAERITTAFEIFVQRHLANQEVLIEMGKSVAGAVPMLARIQTGQQELAQSLLHFTDSMNKKIEMTDTSLAGMWEMLEERRKRSAN